MGCIIRVTALLVVFCTQNFFAYGSVQSIWTNPDVAENVLGSFTKYLMNSGIFSTNQIDDISSISQTILDAFGKSGFSKNISRSKVQALNMAFASSVAEIAFSEDSIVPLSVSISTIIDALRNSMLQNTGAVDDVFLREIKQLINMIAKDRLNENSGSDVSAENGGRQNDFEVRSNARAYEPSSRIPSQGYRADATTNEGYDAGASRAEQPFQQYSASQPTEPAADTRNSRGFNDVSYIPENAQASSQNVEPNAFGDRGNLRFEDRGYSQYSNAVASANAPNYSDYSKQGGNRQGYSVEPDRAEVYAGRDDEGLQETGYPVDIYRDNQATKFGQGEAKVIGDPQASLPVIATNNLGPGYGNENKGLEYNARRESKIPNYATGNAAPSPSRNATYYDVSLATRRGNNGGNDRQMLSSSSDNDAVSKFTNTITSSLLSSNDFIYTFGSGLSVTNAVNIASNLAQSFATQIGLDEARINYLLSLVSQYISAIDSSAGAQAYATAISRAIGDTLTNAEPILSASLVSADTQPITNLINSVTLSTLNPQQPNINRSGGGSNFRNVAGPQVRENRENLGSVQTATEESFLPELLRSPGQNDGVAENAAADGEQGSVAPRTAGDTDVISKFTNTIASILLSSSDFTATFGSGLPVTNALNLASNIAQSLATQLGLDEAAINSLLSLVNQYISSIGASADASTYANAISLALGDTLKNVGNVSPVLASSLASADAQPITNLVNSVTSSTLKAQQPNLIGRGGGSPLTNVAGAQVRENRGNLGPVQTATGKRFQPGLLRSPGQNDGVAENAAAGGEQGSVAPSTAGGTDVISKFTNIIASILLSSSDFTATFGSGLAVTNALNLASNIAQSLATQLGLDEAAINSLLSLVNQYISSIGASADASTYANAISLALGDTLKSASNLSPALTASLASAEAQQITNLVNSVTSSTLKAQQPSLLGRGRGSPISNVAGQQFPGSRGNLASVRAPGSRFQPAFSRYPGQVTRDPPNAVADGRQSSGTPSTAGGTEVISKFTNIIASSLLSSDDFTATFGSGLPVTNALNLASTLAQSLATQLGLDEAAINSVLSLVNQYISAIGASADASAYAYALSLALGETLKRAGNVSPALTASLASAEAQSITNLVTSVTSSTLKAQQPNLIERLGGTPLRSVAATQFRGNLGNLGSLQTSAIINLQPALSRSPSQVAGAAASAVAGGGQGSAVPSTVLGTDVISKFTNTIASSLLSSNDFSATFGSGLPETTALNLATNLALSLATQLGLDEAAINSLLSLVNQYISAIGTSADASLYANALALALGDILKSASNLSPALTASLESAEAEPITNLVNSLTSNTLKAQQPSLLGRGGGGIPINNVVGPQFRGNGGNLASVQSAPGARPESALSRFPGQVAGVAASAVAGGAQSSGAPSTAGGNNVISKFTNTIASSLLSSNDFTAVFGSGLPVTNALNLASTLAQSLATQLGLDEAAINSVLSLVNQYISSIGASADASTYANAISLALGDTLKSASNLSPALTASLASAEAQPITNLVNSVTSSTLKAQQPSLLGRGGGSPISNVAGQQFRGSRRNLASVRAPGARFQPAFSRYPGQVTGAAPSAVADGRQGSGAPSTAGGIDVISKFTNNIASSLLSSNDFIATFGSGLPLTTVLNLATSLAQSLATQLSLDEAAINSLLSLVNQYISAIGSTADATAYANALSLAIGDTLKIAGSLSPVLTESLASADTQAITNLVNSVTSSTLKAQQPDIVGRGGGFRSPLNFIEQGSGNFGNVDSGPQPTVAARSRPSLSRQVLIENPVIGAGSVSEQEVQTPSNSDNVDAPSNLIKSVSRSLVSSSAFSSLFSSNPPAAAVASFAQLLGTQLGLDETGIRSLLNFVNQYVSGIDSSADVSTYAQIISRAVVDLLSSYGLFSSTQPLSPVTAYIEALTNIVNTIVSNISVQSDSNLGERGKDNTGTNLPVAGVSAPSSSAIGLEGSRLDSNPFMSITTNAATAARFGSGLKQRGYPALTRTVLRGGGPKVSGLQSNAARKLTGQGSALGTAVNSGLSHPKLITATPSLSDARISGSGLNGQVNVSPDAVPAIGLGNLAISSAVTGPNTGLSGVSPTSNVGSSAISPPSSPVDPSARISSAASSLISGRAFNPSALPAVISYLANQVRASAVNLSDCEIITQVLLEALSAVTHLLRYAAIDEVNYSDLADTASLIGHALG